MSSYKVRSYEPSTFLSNTLSSKRDVLIAMKIVWIVQQLAFDAVR